ncbi:MAG: hypothetical protein LBB09_01175 [Rickettsiales bacterium]|jgi:hypothetical protein|nr:hypothetical protein [Rickettsiales bacterium]
MLRKSFVRKLEIFNNLLRVIMIFSLGCMVCMKIFLFKNRKDFDRLNSMISNLEYEEEFLRLELSLLTNPKRLEGLYAQLKEKYFAESEALNYRQIKDLSTLYPYFYSKKEGYRLDRTLANR